MRNEVYAPREDSFLLLGCLKCRKGEKVLDMGTGSGILAMGAAKLGAVVTAADISEKALKEAKLNAKGLSIVFVKSDLFSGIKGRYNLIVFNPPYIPEDISRETTNWASGKSNELIRRFLESAKSHLSPKGRVIILVSSLTGFLKLPELKDYRKKKLGEKRLFFEKLEVYQLKRKDI